MKLLLLLLSFIPFQVSAPVYSSKEIYIIKSEPVHFSGFDYQSFVSEVTRKCHHSDILIRQVILEQGQDFSGRFLRERNNLWNFQAWNKKMKDYKVLYFPSIDSCISYMADFQKRKYRKGENYYSFLKRVHFAKDKNYVHKLKNIKL